MLAGSLCYSQEEETSRDIYFMASDKYTVGLGEVLSIWNLGVLWHGMGCNGREGPQYSQQRMLFLLHMLRGHVHMTSALRGKGGLPKVTLRW